MGEGVERESNKPLYADKLYKGGKWRETDKVKTSIKEPKKFKLNDDENEFKVLTN